jgi:hypothetical protein
LLTAVSTGEIKSKSKLGNFSTMSQKVDIIKLCNHNTVEVIADMEALDEAQHPFSKSKSKSTRASFNNS